MPHRGLGGWEVALQKSLNRLKEAAKSRRKELTLFVYCRFLEQENKRQTQLRATAREWMEFYKNIIVHLPAESMSKEEKSREMFRVVKLLLAESNSGHRLRQISIVQ